jgi:hypothetical protein
MPGDRRAEATPFFERLCPDMTETHGLPKVTVALLASLVLRQVLEETIKAGHWGDQAG